jgi:hypothetical protein
MLSRSTLFILFTTVFLNICVAQVTDNAIEVIDMVLSKEVIEREPVNIVNTFTTDDERGWVYARLANSSNMTYIHFVWFHEGSLDTQIRMRVGASQSWRTYTSVALKPGSWRVELQDNARNVLKEIRFQVRD